MKRLTIAGAAVASLMAGSAVAADLPVKARPVPPPVYATSWTGCYLGGHAGYAWSNDDVTSTTAGIVASTSWDPNSFIGGAQLGCQYQITNWVFGLEGTWSGTDLKQTITGTAGGFTGQSTFDLDQIWTATGRVGYAWDHFMLYAKGGFASARIKTTIANLGPPVDSGTTTAWQSGFTVGGGLDYMAWQNIVLGVEFDYYNFGFDRTVVLASGTPSVLTNTNADVFAVLGRVSWLFH